MDIVQFRRAIQSRTAEKVPEKAPVPSLSGPLSSLGGCGTSAGAAAPVTPPCHRGRFPPRLWAPARNEAAGQASPMIFLVTVQRLFALLIPGTPVAIARWHGRPHADSRLRTGTDCADANRIQRPRFVRDHGHPALHPDKPDHAEGAGRPRPVRRRPALRCRPPGASRSPTVWVILYRNKFADVRRRGSPPS